jgi:hypothetical protein
VERTTLYETVQRFEDPKLDPPSLEPAKEVDLSGPARWRRKAERAGSPALETAPVRSSGIAG